MSKDAEDRSGGADSMGPVSEASEGRTQLLSGIQRDARAEAERIVKAAEAAAAERMKAAQVQAGSIREESIKRAQDVGRGIARQGEQAAAVEGRRMALKVREQISARVLAEVSRRLEDMIGRPEYRATLKGWIVEAIVGLDCDEADVLASAAEMPSIDDTLLAEAAAEARAIIGAEVRLSRSSARPLIGQGVVVTTRKGRTAFNNQVATRMERYQSEIRKLIYEALKES